MNYNEAAKFFRKAIALNKNDPEYIHFLGSCYLETNKTKKAFSCFRSELKIHPKSHYAWAGLAQGYLNQSKYEKAIHCCNKALRLNRNDIEAITVKGISCYFLDKLSEAIVHLDRALKLDQDNSDALHFKGHTLVELDDHENAAICFEIESKLGSNFNDGWFQLGKSQLKNENYREAISAFKKSLKEEGSDRETWTSLGLAYGSSNRYKLAETCFKKVQHLKFNKSDQGSSDHSNEIKLTKINEVTRPRNTNEIVSNKKESRKKVLVIHGHDEKAKKVVVNFLKRLGLKPVVLSDSAKQGMTLIQLFEFILSSVGFAIALLTPDDVIVDKHKNNQIRMARPNVIYELGSARTKLGKERVCILKKIKTEIPSDLHGIAYIEMQKTDEWKGALKQELLAAKMAVK